MVMCKHQSPRRRLGQERKMDHEKNSYLLDFSCINYLSYFQQFSFCLRQNSKDCYGTLER